MIYGNYFLEKSSLSKFKFIDIDKDEAKPYLELYYDYKKYKNHIDLFKGEICIDKEKDKLAGIVMVYKKKYPGFITPLEVMKEYRGQGLGKKLLKDAINKYGAIDLVVDKSNKVAISLYKKNGFITIENPDNKSQYYMKLKSKVSSKDKVITESSIDKTLYFLSDKNMDGKTLSPRVPSNFFTKNGYEDDKTPRVSLSTSIHGCLMGISNNLQDKEFYVHKVINNPKTKKPSIEEVPDSKWTKEVWGLSPVKLRCVGLIKVTSAIDTPHKFTYGDNEAELYDWNYKYLKMFKESVINEANSNITFSKSFDDVKNIVDTLSYEELNHICSGTFKDSPYVVYRKVLKYNNVPAAFIDIYSIPGEMDKDEAVVVVACKDEYRGNGYTDMLIKDALKYLKKQNKIKKLYWETTKSNKASSTIAKRNGFVKSKDINKDDDNYFINLEQTILEVASLSKYTVKPITKEIKNKYKSQFKEIIHTDEKGSYAWFDGDELVAFAYVKEDKGKTKTWMHLSNIFVNPKYRSQGIGDAIVKFLIDKYDIKELGVLKTNTNAINLYKKNGFKIDKSYTEKYPDNKCYFMIRK